MNIRLINQIAIIVVTRHQLLTDMVFSQAEQALGHEIQSPGQPPLQIVLGSPWGAATPRGGIPALF